eukprot:16448-Eustigmatos_ZCMA.PRE.1
MTRDEYLSHLDPTLGEQLLSAIRRRLTLRPEKSDELHALQQSVPIDTSRGKHSLMEGNIGLSCAVAELTGYPLERTEEEVRNGLNAIFPSHCPWARPTVCSPPFRQTAWCLTACGCLG